MIKALWEKWTAKIDGMSLRERALIFLAIAFMLVSAIDALFLEPLLMRQKQLSAQVVQQQEKMKEIQAQMAALLQAKQENERSPLRDRIKALRDEMAAGEEYLKSRRDKLVPADKMAELLEQMLSRNGRLQLVALDTLEVTPLIEAAPPVAVGATTPVKQPSQERQVYKHGVQLTVRGSYNDLLQYLTALEKMPAQMFWGSAKMKVLQHPTAELTLTLYTLSLDTSWLKV